MAAGQVGAGAGACCCLSCTVFLIVFFSTSLSKVNQYESCLKYSWWGESVDDEILTEPGMKWVGMGNYLIPYPNYNLYVYFREFGGNSFQKPEDIYHPPLTVRTSDGLTISLEMEFVYQLQKENLKQLYYLVGMEPDLDDPEAAPGGYKQLLSTVAEGVIDNHATTYSAAEFYANRTDMAAQFLEVLREEIQGRLFINILSLQLQPAIFPARYSQAIVDTLDAKQDIQVAQQEFITQEIIKKTDQLKAEFHANTIQIEAYRDANITVLENALSVRTFNYSQQRKADGYKAAMDFFTKEGTSSDFMDYLGVRALDDHKSAGKTVQVTPLP